MYMIFSPATSTQFAIRLCLRGSSGGVRPVRHPPPATRHPILLRVPLKDLLVDYEQVQHRPLSLALARKLRHAP